MAAEGDSLCSTEGQGHEDQHALNRNKRHLRGWYSYAFASEAFVIVSLTLFLPICLEQFARDNGVLLPDKTEPCSSHQISETGHASAQGAEDEANQCVVKIGWMWVNSASFSLYVYSISVALQALTVISMGGIANHPPHRKRALLLFAYLGSISAILFLILPSSSVLWPLIAPLAAIANVGFGASIVAMNAYLPTLAREDSRVRAALHELRKAEGNTRRSSESESEESDQLEHLHANSASEPLLASAEPTTIVPASTPSTPTSPSPELAALRSQYTHLLSRTTARISSLGIALGYSAGIVLLCVALVPVTLMHGSTFALRLAIGMSGVWWAVLTVPAWIWLPDGTGAGTGLGTEEEESAGVKQWRRDDRWSLKREVWKAWKRLGYMLRWREIKALKNTFWYLAAWFLLSDGFTTITSTAILFGKTILHMSPSSLILIGILTPTSGILGSLLWPRLQRRFLWSNRTVLVILVLMASVIPAYGCLGFIPIFKNVGVTITSTDADADDGVVSAYELRFGGLTTQAEMFALAVYFGTVYGAFQGYARAFYAELIPPGDEARWYGLFSITDKSSSFLGPLVVGVIADLTGNIRYAFFFLVFMVWSAVPLLLVVDIDRGRVDAARYSAEIDESER